MANNKKIQNTDNNISTEYGNSIIVPIYLYTMHRLVINEIRGYEYNISFERHLNDYKSDKLQF